ncbi:MAG: Flp pilus assembly complex ATPase component TadA [Sedimentisphaerales bacterium]|nr:Flp pilus assembly complex ATPase component TadA [Sedimentisphaerales bacterium]
MNTKAKELLDNLLQEAFDKKASMVYLLPDEPPVFCIHKNMERSQQHLFSSDQIAEIASSLFPQEKLDMLGVEIPKLTTVYPLPGEVESNICVSRVTGELAMNIMFLPTVVPNHQQCRIPQAILDAAMEDSGLIIFSGKTGSGKTTSMHSVLEYINEQRQVCICTLEYDMLVYHFVAKRSVIQQRSIGRDVPDFASGVSVIMSQYSDVVMIGELRTIDDIQMTLTIAQTGHLVLTQLHEDTPLAAIQKILDAFPQENLPIIRRQLSRLLLAVSSQRLLPRKDGKGRTATYSVLIPDMELRNAILQGNDITMRSTPLPDNCFTMAQDIEDLYQQGVISQETRGHALK